jgi:hypothetical protein
VRWLAIGALSVALAAVAWVVRSQEGEPEFDPLSNTEVSRAQLAKLRKGMSRAEVERRIGRGGRPGPGERFAEPRQAACFYYTGLGGSEAVQLCYRSERLVRRKWDVPNLDELEGGYD